EGYLLLALLPAAFLLDRSRSRREGAEGAMTGSLRLLCAALLPVAPWVLYCLWATGRPLATTFTVKSQRFGPFDADQLGKIGSFLLAQPFAGAVFGSASLKGVAAATGVALLLVGSWRVARRSLPALVLAGLFPLVFYWALSTELPLGLAGGPDATGSI